MSLATTSILRSCAVGSTPSSSGGSYSFVHGDLTNARGEQGECGWGGSELGDQGSGTSTLKLTCKSRHRGCSRRASRRSPLHPWPAAGAGRPCSAGRRSGPARGRPALCSMTGWQLVTSGGATHECGARARGMRAARGMCAARDMCAAGGARCSGAPSSDDSIRDGGIRRIRSSAASSLGSA